MRKTIFVFLLFFYGIFNVSANVTNFLVEFSETNFKENEDFYISIFATDDQGIQVSDLEPKFIVQDESVKIGNFYNCSTAEGRELCGKYDASFIGLQGAYVAKAKTTDKIGDFTVSVFSDANKTMSSNIDISVHGDGQIQVIEAPKELTLNEGPITGDDFNGKQYVYLGLFAIIILMIYGILLSKENKYSTKI